MALPDWVRARGLSVFLTVFFGAMALGSLIRGQIAGATSIQIALIIAGVGALAAVPLTWRAKLARNPDLNLTPSHHWPDPGDTGTDSERAQPTMVLITCRVNETDLDNFEQLMHELKRSRESNGAYGWNLHKDIDSQNCCWPRSHERTVIARTCAGD